jgi:hypothetical protein
MSQVKKPLANLSIKSLLGTFMLLSTVSWSQTSEISSTRGYGRYQIVSNKAQQEILDADIEATEKLLKETFDLSTRSAADLRLLAMGTLMLAAHHDRASMAMPHNRFVVAPKERVDHFMRYFLWMNRLHPTRDRDECVLKRSISEKHSAAEIEKERQLFASDPNYVCDGVITKPKKNVKLGFTSEDWTSPLPSLIEPATAEDLADERRQKSLIKTTYMGHFRPRSLDPESIKVPWGPLTVVMPVGPRSLRELKDAIRERIQKEQVRINRMDFIYSLSMNHKRHLLQPSPSAVVEMIQKAKGIEGSGDFYKVTFEGEGSEITPEMQNVVQKNIELLKQQDSFKSRSANELEEALVEMLSQKGISVKDVAIERVGFQKHLYAELSTSKSSTSSEPIERKLLFSKTSGVEPYTNFENKVEYLTVEDRTLSDARFLRAREDGIDFSKAEEILKRESETQALRAHYANFFGSEKIVDGATVYVAPKLETVMFGIGEMPQSHYQKLYKVMNDFLKDGGDPRVLSEVVQQAPNMPDRFSCTDPTMALPTCTYTIETWERMGRKK